MTLVPSQWTKRTVIIPCNILYGHSYNELSAYRTKGFKCYNIITVHKKNNDDYYCLPICTNFLNSFMGPWGWTVIVFTAFVAFIGHWGIGAGCVCNIYNGGTVQARTKRTTQMRNWRNGCTSSNKGRRQRWRRTASSRTRVGRKRFFFCYSLCQLCFVAHVIKKQNNTRVWRSSVVTQSNEVFMTDLTRD